MEHVYIGEAQHEWHTAALLATAPDYFKRTGKSLFRTEFSLASLFSKNRIPMVATVHRDRLGKLTVTIKRKESEMNE